MAGGSSSTALSMKEYLRRYQSGTEDPSKTKKKKKKKAEKPKSNAMGGVLVVDEDPVWQKPVQLEEESDSDGEEQPQIEEDIEVRRMKRLEEIRAKKPYNAISEDGSGWVTLPDSSPERPSNKGKPDLSPPRHRKGRLDTPSPEGNPRRSERASPEDLSPPRRGRKGEVEGGTADLSSPRRHTRSDLASDLSPPRRRARHDSVENAERSPPRRKTGFDSVEAADLSPPRRSIKGESEGRERKESDLSPPRRNRKGPSDDLSPPRRAHPGPPTKMGLLSSQEMREQTKKMRIEESRMLSTEAFISTKDAEAVFRVNGKRISRDDMVKPKEKEKPKEKPLEWGKGLAQKREAEARALELETEKNKPFARTRDDPELDKMLKETVRWGDPMAHLVKRKNTEPILEDLGDDEKMKESGFIIPQTIPSHSWLKRGLDFPPNRYGIKPGRHWDGVDRSNGFEKESFKRQNEKRATEQEAYLWSVSDM